MQVFKSYGLLFFSVLVVLASLTAHASTIDTSTQGNWIGTYGSQGYALFDYNKAATNSGSNNQYDGAATTSQDVASLPSYVSGYTYSPEFQQYLWQTNQTETRDLEDPRAAVPATAAQRVYFVYPNEWNGRPDHHHSERPSPFPARRLRAGLGPVSIEHQWP